MSRRFSLCAALAIALGCASGADGTRSDAGSATSAAGSSVASSDASGRATSTASASATSPQATASASAPAASNDPLAASRLMADVAWLTSAELRGRGSFSADEAKAAARLGALLDEAQLDTLDGARLVPFEHQGRKSTNVAARIAAKGPKSAALGRELVVLGAHYDHLGVRNGATYFGAEDNASGVAVALGVARALGAHPEALNRPVLVLFFGAEEAWMRGSEAFVAGWDLKARPIHAMVNIDMIGRPLVDQPGLWVGARLLGVLPDVDPKRAVGVLFSAGAPPAFPTLVREACKAHELAAVLVSDLPPSLRPMIEDMARDRSDQAPFEHRGVPTMFFGSGESEDYHQPTDTADKLDPALLELRARAIADVVTALAQ